MIRYDIVSCYSRRLDLIISIINIDVCVNLTAILILLLIIIIIIY